MSERLSVWFQIFLPLIFGQSECFSAWSQIHAWVACTLKIRLKYRFRRIYDMIKILMTSLIQPTAKNHVSRRVMHWPSCMDSNSKQGCVQAQQFDFILGANLPEKLIFEILVSFKIGFPMVCIDCFAYHISWGLPSKHALVRQICS